MIKYLKKAIRKTLGFIAKYKQEQLVKQRMASHKELVDNKQTDYNRWRKDNELHENWNERTTIMANYISPSSKIIEFGAGNMFLKEFLAPNFYTPTDIVKRFDETVLCDLNKPIEINLKKYETAVFSGVLEYVHDIDFVFNQMHDNKIKQVVVSYCCSDIIKVSRDKNGWLSDLKKADLISVFKKYNFAIEDYREWKNQSIFNLKLKC
ncbi:hypothetical protein [Algibacter sp. R77976]|uniref:hypothetical protein n=1 Tax=Algibacter sp. R77976 TaxID=3093873 RepID=UPI0037C8C3C9